MPVKAEDRVGGPLEVGLLVLLRLMVNLVKVVFKHYFVYIQSFYEKVFSLVILSMHIFSGLGTVEQG